MAGGATAITQVFMREMLRQMTKDRSRRDLKVSAYRMTNRTLYKDGVFSASHYKQRADFPCYFLCGGCGYLVEKAQTSCPSCGSDHWMDLGDVDVAQNLREIESEERMQIPKSVTFGLGASLILAYAILVFLVFLVASAASSQAYTGLFLRILLFGLVGGFMLFFFNRRRAAKLYYRLFPKNRPLRWRMPLVDIKKNQQSLGESRGNAKALGQLISPFSGTRCIGYKAGILFDAHGDARPPEWILAESDIVDFELGGARISGERVLVKSELKSVNSEIVASNLGNLSQYLRERGLFQSDGDFQFFEAVVPDDAEIVVNEFEDAKAIAVPSA